MPWLTVREAAETLQISESSVRKKMQRGTLKRRKVDGRVYTYLDASNAVDGAYQSTKESDADESGSRFLHFTDIASLVAGISVGTYIVGLFVFWYPISTTYTGDFATAWYATSLVSRNVIVGHGVQQLLLPYLAFMLIFVGLMSLSSYTDRLPHNLENVADIILVVMACSTIFLLYMYYLGTGPVRVFGEIDRAYVQLPLGPFWGSVILLFSSLGLVGLAFILILRLAARGSTLTRQIWHTHPRFVVAVTGLIFVGFFLYVLSISFVDTKPPLSRVEISGQRLVKGELLTHTGGFWYVFEQREANQGANREVKLVAIPDDEVKDVQVSV